MPNYKMTANDLKAAGISYVKPKNSKYPVEKRLEAVTLYMACGNMRQVEAVTGISYSNLRAWRDQDWWKEMEIEIKAARKSAVATKLNKIVDKALNMVEDRVDNGDWKYNRESQEFERVPLSALTVNKIAVDLLQRGESIEKLQQETVTVQNQQTIQDTLKMLAAEFASFNKARTVNVITKDVTDAIETVVGDSWESGEDGRVSESMEGEEPGEGESLSTGESREDEFSFSDPLPEEQDPEN